MEQIKLLNGRILDGDELIVVSGGASGTAESGVFCGSECSGDGIFCGRKCGGNSGSSETLKKNNGTEGGGGMK